MAAALGDERRQASCQHDGRSLLRQRVYALALGYEDLNAHTTLRADPGLQTAVERDETLASSPTLCRWGNRADRDPAWAIHRVLVEQLIASYQQPPRRVILDFDATDDAVHGNQEGRFFHGYYSQYCFRPLYVFCGSQLLVSYLRPSSADPARHVWVILALLVRRLRAAWPEAEGCVEKPQHLETRARTSADKSVRATERQELPWPRVGQTLLSARFFNNPRRSSSGETAISAGGGCWHGVNGIRWDTS